MLVKEALSKLSKQQYSIEELTRKPLPEGVDPLRLEDYLSDQDFKVGHLASLHRENLKFSWRWFKMSLFIRVTSPFSWMLAETSRDESSWVQCPAKLETEKPEEKQRPVLKLLLYTNLFFMFWVSSLCLSTRFCFIKLNETQMYNFVQMFFYF